MKKNKILNLFFRSLVIFILALLTYFIFSKKNYDFLFMYKKYIESNFHNENIKNENKYIVQIGIFANKSEVDKIKAKLTLIGLTAKLNNYLFNGKLTTKITLGPYNKDAYIKTIKLLQMNNIEYFLINE